MTNPMQPLDPISPPDPVTPAATPSSPAGYAMVTPHGRGPAPYNIQAGNDEAVITAVTNAAGALAGAGIVYPQGPRQAATESLLSSAQGYGAQDIDAGYPGSAAGESGWPVNVEPGG